MMRIDARLPLRFGSLDSRRPNEAVLLDSEAEVAAPAIRLRSGLGGHVPDCACCTPRTAAAQALAELFRSRAVGQGPAFRGVLAVLDAGGEAAVRTALADDVLVAGRYRLVSN